jgi:hypothetical protein
MNYGLAAVKKPNFTLSVMARLQFANVKKQ